MIKKEFKKIMLKLCELKFYQSSLRMSSFINEEIMPPIEEDSEDEKNLRLAYQKLKAMINEEQVDKGTSYVDKILESSEYITFRKSFFKIQDTSLINMVAIDTIKRMTEIGDALRFASTIPLKNEKSKAVQ